MISFNDIIYISKLHNTNNYKQLSKFITKKIPCNNILDFLHRIKEQKFTEENSVIKLNTKKGELLIYKENFLKGIPTYKESIHLIDDYFITIGYPSINFFSDASFIKKIEKDGILISITKDNYTDIPLSLIKKCSKHINQYKESLYNIFVYYVNEKYNSRFFYSPDVITYIVYLCMVQDYESLLEEQLFLMRQCSFSYHDFDRITFDEFKKYITLLLKSLKNERASN